MGGYHEQVQEPSTRAKPFVCHPDGAVYLATRDGNTLIVRNTQEKELSIWQLRQPLGRLTLEWAGPCSGELQTTELLAAIEAAFTSYPEQHRLDLFAPTRQADELLSSGIIIKGEQNRLTICAELFWQQPRIWLTSPRPDVFPLYYILSQGQRHPLRPPKPSGTVYRRHIPWLDHTLSFRVVDLEYDLERFSRWMNDPVVAQSWQEEGDLAKHRAYLEGIAADPRTIGLIGCLNDEAFGYFEVYWAKEDHIAPFYDADDFDRGWHVLIGEAAFRGKPFVTSWLPSISHYLFLDDCRTRRIVIEPRSDNHKMIRNLTKCGYANLKEFDFPHKRALLAMLLRERFFFERLWVPRDNLITPSSESLSRGHRHAHS